MKFLIHLRMLAIMSLMNLSFSNATELDVKELYYLKKEGRLTSEQSKKLEEDKRDAMSILTKLGESYPFDLKDLDILEEFFKEKQTRFDKYWEENKEIIEDAKKGDREALLLLGCGTHNGTLPRPEKREDLPIRLLLESAKKGYAPAIESLSGIHEMGFGPIGKDLSISEKLTTLAFSLDDPSSESVRACYEVE